MSLGLELLAIGQGSRDFGWFAYAPLNRDVVVGPAPASAYLSALCDLARWVGLVLLGGYIGGRLAQELRRPDQPGAPGDRD